MFASLLHFRVVVLDILILELFLAGVGFGREARLVVSELATRVLIVEATLEILVTIVEEVIGVQVVVVNFDGGSHEKHVLVLFHGH